MTTLRTGFTTGACAAAAAKAAALLLVEGRTVASVEIPFPNGTRNVFPVEFVRLTSTGAEAAIRKSAGDDPDITDGVMVVSTVTRNDDDGVRFQAGEGIGTVTKPGLQVPPGQPAINPAPRRMIQEALQEVTREGLTVTVSIPGGQELAAKTFNPRLGITGGLSILGTSGQVRPFSVPALRDALVCAMDVAVAVGVTAPILVPGNIGRRAAQALFTTTTEQIIEVSNEWGFMLDQAAIRAWARLLLVGHPGKLAKLAMNEWDTHSSQSPSVVPFLRDMCTTLGLSSLLDQEVITAEGLFQSLSRPQQRVLGNRLASDIQTAVEARTGKEIAVVLVMLSGEELGSSGEMSPWR
jgi:cobalt-precorrin-5B (C1)-methyltransferase